MNTNFDDLLFRAGLCERAEKYEEMVTVTKKSIIMMQESKIDSQTKARNLFSVAYKNLAGSKRSSWRVLSTEHLKHKGEEGRANIVLEYMQNVESELNAICDDVIQTIDKHILNSVSFEDAESKVFFYKMKGDYFRYKAEVAEDNSEEQKKVSNLSRNNYEEAKKLAEGLKNTNPVKLGLALNYSVYLYEIAKNWREACDVAKKAFDEAIAGLDQLSEEHYKDSTLIMQLLRDNMTLWANQDDQGKEENECFVEEGEDE